VNNIVKECSRLFEVLLQRKSIEYGLVFRECFFIAPNCSVIEKQITTKQIRQRLFFKHKLVNSDLAKPWNELKKVLHPKEKEVAFLKAHEATLSNQKLFHMKLINSPLCAQCNCNQDIEHIFTQCINALEAQIAVNSVAHQFEHDYIIETNINSLINRLLFLNKDKVVKADLFCIAIDSRLQDLEQINQNRRNKKVMIDINKLSLI
jgi:hypothetical protein